METFLLLLGLTLRLMVTVVVAIIALIAGFYSAILLLHEATAATTADWLHSGMFLAVILIPILPGVIAGLRDRWKQ